MTQTARSLATDNTTDADAPSDQALLARYAPVFQRIAEGALERERNGQHPAEALQWLRESGFTAVRVPRVFGGGGASLRQLHLLLIALAAADSNLSHALRVHFRFTEGHWAQRDLPSSVKWLRRIADGAVIGAGNAERTGEHGKFATNIRRVGDGYVLNGQKYYTTGSLYADYVSVSVTTETGELATVVVSTKASGVEVIDDWVGFGQKGSGSGTTVFRDTPIDAADVAPPVAGSGARWAHVQLSHLATTAGIVRRATDEITDFVKQRPRTYRQASAAIAKDDPLIQAVVGRADATAYALQAIVLQAASTLDEVANAQWSLRVGPETGRTEAARAALHDRDIEAGLDTYRAQAVVFELALKTTTEIFEVGGSSAVDRNRHLDRHWRNVRTLASHNPLIYRHRQLGENRLNGNPPYNFLSTAKTAALGGESEDAALGV
ncbi:acyl-CoA dehydrogenase family protein [Bordetella sp. LUAb4]|uniref:acyl-CoA dehydrogenase family protein n=1 Tax=Bordetella sp. LUAb4 TaxID=2843195 RepID=UPI001E434EA4|nr:acyl-CoA dehydrogenase family protein [Bordetella sp. LUAb4]